MQHSFFCTLFYVYTSFLQFLSVQGMVSIAPSIPVARIPSTSLYSGISYTIACNKGHVHFGSLPGSSVEIFYCGRHASSFMFQAISPNTFILWRGRSIVTLGEVNGTTTMLTVKEGNYGRISQSTVTRSLITPLHISGEDMEAKYQLRFVNQGDSFSTVYAKFDLTLDDSNKLDVHFASNDSDANTDFDEGSLAWNETLFAFNILTAGNKLTGYFNNLAFPDLNETMVVLKQTLVNTGPYGLRSSFQMGWEGSGKFEINRKDDIIPRYKMSCVPRNVGLVELTNPNITGMKIDTVIPPGGRVECLMKHWVVLDETIPFVANFVVSGQEDTNTGMFSDLHPLVVLATLSNLGINVTDAVLDEDSNRVKINMDGSLTGPFLTRVENPVAKCEPFAI
ncbi:uncharacterized protein LOC118433010 isoform X2 [Folsomia candida]|uniref:uncharacterized protein LOC118433010 isoform X2 n=1 Tax=Folsomia candida TaxID=158441 RepID=UPI001604C108|nr:uncharacterized protein LOC118433010 isoform X2 [Folsomia candida]